MVKNTKRNSKRNINNRTIKYGGMMPNVNFNPKGRSLEEISKILSDAGYNVVDYIDRSTNVFDIDRIPAFIRPVLRDFVAVQNRNIKITAVSVVAGTIGALLTPGVAQGVATAATAAAATATGSIITAGQQSLAISAAKVVYSSIPNEVFDAIGKEVYRSHQDLLHAIGKAVLNRGLDKIPITNNPVIDNALHNHLKPTKLSGLNIGLNIINQAITGEKKFLNIISDSQSYIINGRTETIITREYSMGQRELIDQYVSKLQDDVFQLHLQGDKVRKAEKEYEDSNGNSRVMPIKIRALKTAQTKLKNIKERISKYEIPLSISDLLTEFFGTVYEGSISEKQIHMFSSWNDIVTAFLTSNPPHLEERDFVETGNEFLRHYNVINKRLNYDKVTKTDEEKVKKELQQYGNSNIHELFQLKPIQTVEQSLDLKQQQQEDKLARQYGEEYARQDEFDKNVNMADFVGEVVAESIEDYAEDEVTDSQLDIKNAQEQLFKTISATAIATAEQIIADEEKKTISLDAEQAKRYDEFYSGEREFTEEVIKELNVADREYRPELEVGQDIGKRNQDEKDKEYLDRSKIKEEHLERFQEKIVNEILEDFKKEYGDNSEERVGITQEEKQDERDRRWNIIENHMLNKVEKIIVENENELKRELKDETIKNGRFQETKRTRELAKKLRWLQENGKSLVDEVILEAQLDDIKNEKDSDIDINIQTDFTYYEDKFLEKRFKYKADFSVQNLDWSTGWNSYFTLARQDTSLLEVGALSVLKYREGLLKKCIVKAREETIRRIVKTDKPFKGFNHILHEIYNTTIPTTDEARILEYNTAMRQYNGNLAGVIDLIEKLKREIIKINEKMDRDLRDIDEKLKEDIKKYDTNPYELACGIMEAKLGLGKAAVPKKTTNWDFQELQSGLSKLQTDIVSKLYGNEITKSLEWNQLEEFQSNGNSNFSEHEQNILRQTINAPYVTEVLFYPADYSQRREQENAKKAELVRLLDNILQLKLSQSDNPRELVNKFKILFDKQHPDFNIVYRKINKDILTLDETNRWNKLLRNSEPITRNMLELLDFNIDDIKTELQSIRLDEAASEISFSASDNIYEVALELSRKATQSAYASELETVSAAAAVEEEEEQEQEEQEEQEQEEQEEEEEEEEEEQEEEEQERVIYYYPWNENRIRIRTREHMTQRIADWNIFIQDEARRNVPWYIYALNHGDRYIAEERDAAEQEANLQAERDAAEQEAKLQAERDAAEQEAIEQSEKPLSEEEINLLTSPISLEINPEINSMFEPLFNFESKEGILTGIKITDDNLLNYIKNEFQHRLISISPEILNRTHIITFLENETKELTDYRDAIYNEEITRMSDYKNADRYFYLSVNADRKTYEFRIAASIGEELKTGSFIYNIKTHQSLFMEIYNPTYENSIDELMIELDLDTTKIIEEAAKIIKQQAEEEAKLQSASRIHRRPQNPSHNYSQNYSNTGRNTRQVTSTNGNTNLNFR